MGFEKFKMKAKAFGQSSITAIQKHQAGAPERRRREIQRLKDQQALERERMKLAKLRAEKRTPGLGFGLTQKKKEKSQFPTY